MGRSPARVRVAVAASNRLAADAGVRLGEVGGNAVDAALAAALVATVCEPGLVSLAGGAYVTVAPTGGGEPVTVDGYVEMPGRGLPRSRVGGGAFDVTTAYGGGVTMTVGHGSVATPGTPAAFAETHRRFGRAPWAEVVAPAVEAARDGFPLGSASSYYLRYVHDSVFGWHADSRAALHDASGALLPEGATVRVPHLAETYESYARDPSTFATGRVAELVAADMAAHDGLLTAADLAAYRPVVRPALAVDAGAWRLATNPAPSIGGPVLAAMLTLMAGRPQGEWTPSDVAHLVAVQDAVLRHRVDVLDVAEDRAAAGAALLSLAGRGLAALRGSASTVHVSTVDSAGGACAVTTSAGYGSGVMTPGTGLWLNNCLGEQELNRRGLLALAPGDRLASNMAPTVGRTADGAALAIGSPGADRITTALVQVLAAFAYGGASLEAAIGRPRLHVRPSGDGPVVEHEADVALPPLSWPTREHHRLSMYFGGVGAALRTGAGDLLAAGDPRRAAAVAVSPPRT